MENYHFKVNLKGMIDLLSNHLYSTPHVFVRELIQNSVDAITAREKHLNDPKYKGQIDIEIHPGEDHPTLFIQDNGIGLTEDEVHQFLAQIGQTSKRNADGGEDFIGRFGVGLLSCFIVSDEIVFVTRSIQSDYGIEWRGKPDGTYTLNKLKDRVEPGTRVYLKSKTGFDTYFEQKSVAKWVRHYGEYLPYPLYFHDQNRIQLNSRQAPWEMNTTEALAYGKSVLQQDYLDAIALESALGDVKGIAYLLPYPVQVNARQKHRVYAKNMLLSDHMDKLLPEWAFFATSILNVNGLSLTVSRESFHDDARLELVRTDLGNCIKNYLIQLVEANPKRLQEIIQIHYKSIKALATTDDALFQLFINWLPFETTLGRITMSEVRKNHTKVYYTTSVDEFRQINKIARAQGICVINGGYVHDSDLIEKMQWIDPTLITEKISPTMITQKFNDLVPSERQTTYTFIKLANEILQPYFCKAVIKKFEPHHLPVLYTTSEEALYLRTTTQTAEEVSPLFSSIMQKITENQVHTETAQLCFNYHNPIVQKLINTTDNQLQKSTIEMLYVQALLLGHYPLKQEEMNLLNEGLTQLVDRGLNQEENK
ncbi:HSP90 family protein [Hazenella sp. IB182357]|uniref:HSP90 family protein n=1 Tax=Polycladospora coralii TaxID=2771432 RepID=A0A926NB39_9BACL|nr:HSP90 family protein [Polycladospora coralii]MBD1373626.1 HSP90 family protein [Polycladospora coralii]MBS7529668.1 HSP90 family protein [Polycladospora coralii]